MLILRPELSKGASYLENHQNGNLRHSQPDIPINSLIASQYGFGFDGLLQFYQHDSSIYDDLVDSFIEKQIGERLPHPYCIPPHPLCYLKSLLTWCKESQPVPPGSMVHREERFVLSGVSGNE